MMFNLPIPDGTTAHAVGGTLIALILGPAAACIAVTVALLIQALIFGDGGILSFGANCFNMAFILPFTGYYLYRGLAAILPGSMGNKIAILVGAYCGINFAAACAAVEFGIQPMLFHDAMGRALYSPYPLAIALPAMIIPHLTVGGIAEAVFTLAIYEYIKKVSPGTILNTAQTKISYVMALVLALIAISPLGLLAEGTAWGEWGAEEIAETTGFGGNVLGYIPFNMENGFQYEALIPDYSLSFMPEWLGYILSALVGVALLVIFFKVLGSVVGGRKAQYHN